jgi:hypothetical protein
MTSLTCSEVREATAEFALDILPSHERSLIGAHLLRCPECRAEVEAMSGISARLLELVPGTEPPLGFDERVLALVRPDVKGPRRFFNRRPGRVFAGLAAVAAAVVLIVSLSLGWFQGGSGSNAPGAALTAAFIQNGRDVGDVYGSRSPAWVDMRVVGLTGAEKVTCQLLHKDGHVTTVGSFDVVDGSGRWGAPDPGGFAGVTGARLLDDRGQVIATATFH